MRFGKRMEGTCVYGIYYIINLNCRYMNSNDISKKLIKCLYKSSIQSGFNVEDK